MTVYGYLRVSTDKQDCANQKIGVERLAEQRRLPIDSWIVDNGVSGTKEPHKRKLGKLLKKIKTGDVIICSELSRLGRKLFMIIAILEHCMKIGATVLTVKDGYELGDDVQSKVMAFAFGLVAEVERDMISKRTKEALARRKSSGKQLGRPRAEVASLQTARRLALIHSEVSEALEACRKGKRADLSAFKANGETKEAFEACVKDSFEDELTDAVTFNRNPEVVKKLLELGADKTLKDKAGKVAADYIVMNGLLLNTDVPPLLKV